MCRLKVCRWAYDVSWTDYTRSNITALRLIFGMRDFETTVAQDETMLMFRHMASQYPEYNITTFMPLWLFCDQYIAILPHTLEVRPRVHIRWLTCTARACRTCTLASRAWCSYP